MFSSWLRQRHLALTLILRFLSLLCEKWIMELHLLCNNSQSTNVLCSINCEQSKYPEALPPSSIMLQAIKRSTWRAFLGITLESDGTRLKSNSKKKFVSLIWPTVCNIYIHTWRRLIVVKFTNTDHLPSY